MVRGSAEREGGAVERWRASTRLIAWWVAVLLVAAPVAAIVRDPADRSVGAVGGGAPSPSATSSSTSSTVALHRPPSTATPAVGPSPTGGSAASASPRLATGAVATAAGTGAPPGGVPTN